MTLIVGNPAAPIKSTNTRSSGTNASVTEDHTVKPALDSIQTVIGRRISSFYSSVKNMLVGGYVNPFQVSISTSAGSGTHDKMVVSQQDANLLGGNVAAFVGYEAGISSMGSSTSIAGTAFYLVKNMTGVSGTERIGTFGGYVNQDPRVLTISAGPYLNSDLREIAPSRSAGLVVGRYYSSPLKSMAAPTVVATGVIYVTYIHVPRRCTPTKLGCNVTTAAAGNVILGLYKVADNTLTKLVAQTAQISTATTGAKEGTVSTQIDSGTYAIVATFSGTPTINWHEINNHDMIGAASATGYSEQAYISPFAFGVLPATANILPSFTPNTIEPHLWFRL